MATASPVAMSPTATEHDFRFPRRPGSRRSTERTSAREDARPGGRDEGRQGEGHVLGSALFPSLETAAGDAPDGFELQHQESLAAQVWRFFSKTKQQLPNQQRMENLTWRMMALSLRRRRQQQQQQQQNRYLPAVRQGILLPPPVMR